MIDEDASAFQDEPLVVPFRNRVVHQPQGFNSLHWAPPPVLSSKTAEFNVDEVLRLKCPPRDPKSRSPWRAAVARPEQLPRRFEAAAAGGPAVSRPADDQWHVPVAAVVGP